MFVLRHSHSYIKKTIDLLGGASTLFLSLFLSGCQTPAHEPASVAAPSTAAPQHAMQQLRRLHAGQVTLDWNHALAMPLFVRFGGGFDLAESEAEQSNPERIAMRFLESTGSLWSLSAPQEELRVHKVVRHPAGTTIKLRQHMRGVPVESAQLNISLGPDGRVVSVTGALSPPGEIDPAAAMSSTAALSRARQAGALPEGQPELVVVNGELVGRRGATTPYLAWKLSSRATELTPTQTLYLDAQSGEIRDRATQELGLYREVWQASLILSDPFDTLILDEAGPVGGRTPDKDAQDTYDAVARYDAYLASYGLTSFTSHNDWYKSSVHYWKADLRYGGAVFQYNKDVSKAFAGFGKGMPRLDVVSHEWTHGLLFYTGDLFNLAAQSAALHEGFADIIACMVDSADWDVGGKRLLSNPDPKAGYHNHYSQYSTTDEAHKNATIFGMAGFLIGDTGCNVHPLHTPKSGGACVQGIGRDKASRIFLRAITHHLFPSADFRAARWAVLESCNELADFGKDGISARDCDSVYAAFRELGFPTYDTPTVRVDPAAGNLATQCIDEGGEGFPPRADVTLMFEDLVSGVIGPFRVKTDDRGKFAHHFGLACTGADAAEAATLANQYLDRVDPARVGFRDRPMRYWAQFEDGGVVRSNTVGYTLSYGGTCVPDCSGKSCGDDGCGGVCGLCAGASSCSAGRCVAGPTSPGLTVCGTLSGSNRWSAAQSPILVNCDVTVSGSLTIDPGVVVMFGSSDTDLFIGAGASFDAVGTSGAPIVFTARSAMTAASWGGIDISGDAVRARIVNAEFRYAGASSFGAGFPILTSGRIQPEIQNVRFLNNHRQAIGLKTGTYTSNVRLNVVGVPYVIASDITINAGATMTIDPGVIVKFEGVDTDLWIYGRLVAEGTGVRPIYFTSYKDDARGGDTNNDGPGAATVGDWGGIYLGKDPSLPVSSLANAVIAYGGSTSYAGLRYPLSVTGRTQPIINNLSISNSRRNGLALATGTYASDLRLSVTAVPYLIDGDVTVNAGVTMTIDPGVVVKFEGVDTDLWIYGRLSAAGTSARPISFTSYKDDARGGDTNNDGPGSATVGDWGGIYLGKDPSLLASTLTDAVISFGGSTSYAGLRYPLSATGRTQPTISNLSILNSRRNALALATGVYPSDLRLNVTAVPYLIDGDVTVNAGVTMTIDPGVMVKFEGVDTDLWIYGRLISEGTATQPIYFTSYKDDARGGDTNNDGPGAAAVGDWGGIYLGKDPALSPSSIFNASISFGGSTSYAGLRYPLSTTGRTQPLLSNLSISNSRRNALALATGTYPSDLRLNVTAVPYLIDSDVTVSAGVTMTIDPGVIVKLEGVDTDLFVDGTLAAEGTAARPIVLTSYRDDAAGGDTNNDGSSTGASGDWGGLVLSATASNVRLRGARVAFGGSSSPFASDCAVSVIGSAPLIEGVDFDRNEDALCAFSGGRPDVGGGALGSKGGNRFFGHALGGTSWALYSASSLDIYARNNSWGYATSTEIDTIIRDHKDSASAGEVLYDGYLTP